MLLQCVEITFELTFIISYLAAFIFSDYKNYYLLSILHLYHHLFAELVHLYNLPLYWVCWGHKRLFIIWLQGCLRETIFILRLLRIYKPQVIHLREICYCPTNLCTWRPNNVYKKKVVQQTSDIIDRTISNKVRLRRLDTPLRCGVPGGVSCETIPHCFK